MSFVILDSNGLVQAYLFTSSVCKVGRSNADWIIEHQTISRYQADLSVDFEKRRVKLIDRSTFKQTKINGNRLLETQGELKAGDIFSFGVVGDFKLEWRPLIILMEKTCQNILDLANKSGVFIKTEFRNDAIGFIEPCPSTCQTKKVKEDISDDSLISGTKLASMVSGIPLISESYLEEISRLKSGARLIPRIDDFTLKSSWAEGSRTDILRNTRIIFFDEHMKKEYSKALTLCGAQIEGVDQAEETTEQTILMVRFESETSLFQFPDNKNCFKISIQNIIKHILNNNHKPIEGTRPWNEHTPITSPTSNVPSSVIGKADTINKDSVASKTMEGWIISKKSDHVQTGSCIVHRLKHAETSVSRGVRSEQRVRPKTAVVKMKVWVSGGVGNVSVSPGNKETDFDLFSTNKRDRRLV